MIVSGHLGGIRLAKLPQKPEVTSRMGSPALLRASPFSSFALGLSLRRPCLQPRLDQPADGFRFAQLSRLRLLRSRLGDGPGRHIADLTGEYRDGRIGFLHVH